MRSSTALVPLTTLLAMALLAAARSDAAATTAPAIDPADAAAVFEAARALSARDAGRLWGKPLYGPMLLVDPATRTIVANQKDAAGTLAPVDGHPKLFSGTLPPGVGVANTATNWAGVRWTILM